VEDAVDLSQTGESRIRGYLYVLERSLRTFLPPPVVADALREVESHIRERLDQIAPVPADERAGVERVLAELGPPLTVAQAYAAEMTVEEAIATGRLLAVGRALWHIATSTVAGFFAGLALFTGYVTGFSFVLVALLKPIFPENVGFIFRDGYLRSFGASFPLPPGTEARGGYWIVPFALLAGVSILMLTQRGARRLLAWWRARQASWRAERLAPPPATATR
jgi:hypothetical protein